MLRHLKLVLAAALLSLSLSPAPLWANAVPDLPLRHAPPRLKFTSGGVTVTLTRVLHPSRVEPFWQLVVEGHGDWRVWRGHDALVRQPTALTASTDLVRMVSTAGAHWQNLADFACSPTALSMQPRQNVEAALVQQGYHSAQRLLPDISDPSRTQEVPTLVFHATGGRLLLLVSPDGNAACIVS